MSFQASGGYLFTKQNLGGNDAKDSDVDSSGKTGVITLGANQQDITVDAGLYRKACVGDKVWQDSNHNWVQDAGEAGIGGIKIKVGSSVERDVRLAPGDSVELAGYTFAFMATRHAEGPNFSTEIGDFSVEREGRTLELHAEKRNYHSQMGNMMTEAAIESGFTRDIYVSMGALFQGYRVVRGPDVRAFENSATHAGDEFRRKVRIACQAFNIHRRLWPRLRRLGWLDLYKYLSHKFLRWLTIYTLGLAGLCFLAALVRLAGWPVGLGLAALGGLTLALGHVLRLPVLGKLVDVLGAFLATGLGVIYSIQGREFRTWTPAASVRS